jgi:hypothetical protein
MSMAVASVSYANRLIPFHEILFIFHELEPQYNVFFGVVFPDPRGFVQITEIAGVA